MDIFSSEDTRFNGASVAVDWITDLESSDSRLHKERVIEKALMASKLGSASAQAFLFNAYLAYNPFYTYNIKQVPETQGLTNCANPWTEFWALCEALRTVSITGNHMRRMVEECSKKFDSEEWNNLARRVLIKDLRCGISEKTLNKILGNTEWAIPTFSCQLAQDSEDKPNKLRGQKQLDPKLDGIRVIAILQNRMNVSLFSRNGKKLNNFPQIEKAILENQTAFLQKLEWRKNFVLDGEVTGESFQKLMKQAHRKSDVQTDNMVYNIFDIMPFDDFKRGYWNAQQHKRTALLRQVNHFLPKDSCLKVVQGIEVDLDTAEGHDVMRRYAEDMIAQGFEGIMIKDQNSPYECKRNDNWLKWKPTITLDLKIVGFEQGTGRNHHRLGAIICEGEDNDRTIRVNVGSGFSDTARDEYWHNRSDLLGHLVEIQADAVTQNQDGSYSLRFPRFVRFRDFEAGEKV